MNTSLVTADRTTHLKILAVSILAAMLVVWIGIGARVTMVENRWAKQGLERSMSLSTIPETTT